LGGVRLEGDTSTMTTKLTVRRLSMEDTGEVRRRFSCGEPAIDRYFHEHASQNHLARLNTTHVAVLGGSIVGFITTRIGSAHFPKDLAFKVKIPGAKKRSIPLPGYEQSVLLIAQLGTHKDAQGGGIATELIGYALALALDLREEHGCIALTVDPLNERVANWYKKRFGFRVLDTTSDATSGRPPMMFLALDEAEAIRRES
jgi:ribosomal protein S18 acetylase RimI-like enzyme